MSNEETPTEADPTPTAEELYTQFLVDEMRFDFSHHAPDEEGLKKITNIRRAFKLLGEVLIENTPSVDERSMALGELKSALHWAMAAATVGAARTERKDEINGRFQRIQMVAQAEAIEAESGGLLDLLAGFIPTEETTTEEGEPS